MSEQKKPAVINVGGTSIMALFAVLCLTVFAVMSLLYAGSQKNLSEKYAKSVEGYYAADTTAAEIYERALKGDFTGIDTIISESGEVFYSYSVEIDQTKTLDVLLTKDTLRVASWKVNVVVDHSEDTLSVWDGRS